MTTMTKTRFAVFTCLLGLVNLSVSAAIDFAPLKNADGTLGLSASAAGGASVSQTAPLRATFWDGAPVEIRQPAVGEWRYSKGPGAKDTGSMRIDGEKIILTCDFSKGGKRYVSAFCPVALPNATQASFTVNTDQRRLLVRVIDAAGRRHLQTHIITTGKPDMVTVPFISPPAGASSWDDDTGDKTIKLPVKEIEILVHVDYSGKTGAAEISDLRFVNENVPAPAVLQGGYLSLDKTASGEWLGKGALKTPGGAALEFTDRWNVSGEVLRLQREVRVKGDVPGTGFGTVAALRIGGNLRWPQMQWFAPGMIYGNFDHMRPNSFGAGNYYKPGDYTVWIREDRMPAPLLAARLPSGSTVAVLNSAPDGATFAAEGWTFSRAPLSDERIRTGSILAEERADGITLGYAFPTSEGTLSYGRKTGIGPETARIWRHRFHPLKDGLSQRYEVSFRFAHAGGMRELLAQNWRWAWDTLRPQVNPQPLDILNSSFVDVLDENYMEFGDVAGVQHVATATHPQPHTRHSTSLGFTGYGIGSAEMMLVESARDPDSARGRSLRERAEKIIAAFLKLPVSPPVTEHFLLKTDGIAEVVSPPANKPPRKRALYLRNFTDDMKSLMRAYEREQKAGRKHPEWIAWTQTFADWLLTQERPGGGFPRAWHPITREPFSDSTTGTFNVVPFYVQLHRVTGNKAYLDAAIRSGDFAWNTGHDRACFTGGTIDNPDVIDKEAATISLEAYLALHSATRDKKWLDRARAAADAAESWMYIWSVPMPADATNEQLHWQHGQSTVGVQLITSGHSLTDAYMSWDVASYARLARETGDRHYMDVARILLHNTKAMAGRPGDLRGMRGPGWQQEHWCFSIPRGLSRHREWLPWVIVSHLRGANDLIDYDPELYKQLAADKPPLGE